MTVALIHGNALTLPLADQSVHLIVSSPPYFSLRSYRDGDEHYDGQLGSEESPHHFLAALWQVMDECWRVLRDDGSAWINLGDKFAGSGGGNQSGVLSHRNAITTAIHEGMAARNMPKRYNQNTGGLRPKSRMLLPHLFAAGCQTPWLRQAIETQAGLQPTTDPPQWICRMDAVWSKPNGLPESVTDRVRASHEYWFHLVKSERYYSALDTIREPHLCPSNGATFGGTKAIGAAQLVGASGRRTGSNTYDDLNPLGKLPGSVWEIATEPLLLPDHLPQHFAAFPSEWPRRLVLGWSPSGVCVRCGEGRRPVCESSYEHINYTTNAKTQAGSEFGSATQPPGFVARKQVSITGTACACPTPDAPTRPSVVLDMFGGTGTTAIVASALGRHGVSVDLSADYHRIARWRDQDGGLRAKALGVAKPEKQLEGQLSLLGEAGS